MSASLLRSSLLWSPCGSVRIRDLPHAESLNHREITVCTFLPGGGHLDCIPSLRLDPKSRPVSLKIVGTANADLKGYYCSNLGSTLTWSFPEVAHLGRIDRSGSPRLTQITFNRHFALATPCAQVPGCYAEPSNFKIGIANPWSWAIG